MGKALERLEKLSKAMGAVAQPSGDMAMSEVPPPKASTAAYPEIKAPKAIKKALDVMAQLGKTSTLPHDVIKKLTEFLNLSKSSDLDKSILSLRKMMEKWEPKKPVKKDDAPPSSGTTVDPQAAQQAQSGMIRAFGPMTPIGQ